MSKNKQETYFYQMFMGVLLQRFLNKILLYFESCDDFTTYYSDENEQQVLFYICGYILNNI